MCMSYMYSRDQIQQEIVVKGMTSSARYEVKLQ